MSRGPRLVDGQPRRPVSRVVVLRLPEGLAAAIDALAAAEGMTAATVARRTLAATFTADPGDVQAVRRYRAPRPAPSFEVIRLAELREALGEANGTLRKVAGIDRGRGGMRFAEINHAIDGLLSAVGLVDGWKAATEAAPEAEP